MKTASGSSKAAALVSLFFTILLFVGAGWVLLNRQYVLDQLTVWQYKPSAEIAALADSSQMNDKGRFYFYASTPQLDGTTKFNDECRRQEQGNAILGCYSGGHIFVYDIKDERLKGVREVTAAHETLHAIYARLSSGDKARINTLLDAEYQKLLTSQDAQLKERMEYYERTEPGERDNELHSIIGTEVAAISPELEAYYRQYFTDRHALVKLHDAYNSKFDTLEHTSTSLKAELEQLSSDINTMTNQYNSNIQTLNNDIEVFNTRAARGGYTSQSEFQSARTALVARVDALKATRTSIDAKIADYETKRQAYNKTVDESNSLTRSLDSSLAPAPSI